MLYCFLVLKFWCSILIQSWNFNGQFFWKSWNFVDQLFSVFVSQVFLCLERNLFLNFETKVNFFFRNFFFRLEIVSWIVSQSLNDVAQLSNMLKTLERQRLKIIGPQNFKIFKTTEHWNFKTEKQLSITIKRL